MSRLESGPARTEAMYQLVFFLACVAFGSWFLYDWRIGYPAKNRAEAITKLPAFVEDPKLESAPLYDKLDDKPNEADFAKLGKALDATAGTPQSIEQVRSFAGEPELVREEGGRRVEYYLSKTSGLKVEVRDGRVQPIAAAKSWKTWNKSYEETENQKWWGLVPLVLSLMFLRKFLQSVTLRARLDEREMTYGGVTIPYDRIESIQDYSPKGWVDVYYRDPADRRKKLRIDNQKVQKFEEIVDELCRIKGVPNPILEHRAAQAAEGGPST